LPQKATCSLSRFWRLMLHWGGNPKCFPGHSRCGGGGNPGYFLDILLLTYSYLTVHTLLQMYTVWQESFQLFKNNLLFVWKCHKFCSRGLDIFLKDLKKKKKPHYLKAWT
jgi:hypothetical protein